MYFAHFCNCARHIFTLLFLLLSRAICTYAKLLRLFLSALAESLQCLVCCSLGGLAQGGSVKWNEMKKKSVALLSRSSRICVWGVVKKAKSARCASVKDPKPKVEEGSERMKLDFSLYFRRVSPFLRSFYHQLTIQFQLIELAAAHESNSNATRLLSASTKWYANETKAPTTLFFLPPFSATSRVSTYVEWTNSAKERENSYRQNLAAVQALINN